MFGDLFPVSVRIEGLGEAVQTTIFAHTIFDLRDFCKRIIAQVGEARFLQLGGKIELFHSFQNEDRLYQMSRPQKGLILDSRSLFPPGTVVTARFGNQGYSLVEDTEGENKSKQSLNPLPVKLQGEGLPANRTDGRGRPALGKAAQDIFRHFMSSSGNFSADRVISKQCYEAFVELRIVKPELLSDSEKFLLSYLCY